MRSFSPTNFRRQRNGRHPIYAILTLRLVQKRCYTDSFECMEIEKFYVFCYYSLEASMSEAT